MAAPTSLLKGFARVVATTKPDPKKRIAVFDPETQGLCVRITPAGGKSYTVVARNPAGKQVWAVVGDVDAMTLEQARTKAKEGVQRIKDGHEPFPVEKAPPTPDSAEAVIENFLARHVGKVTSPDGAVSYRLRGGGETDRIFTRYVTPEWKGRPFISIRRGDVSALLDQVEDNNGPVMADRVLAAVSKLCNWFASRNDDYSSPIVRGMSRTKPRERARKRILSDDEIRTIWPVCPQAGNFGAFVQVSLLTAQRRAKVAAMQWTEIDDDGTWTIATVSGEKGNPGSLGLPDAALKIIRGQNAVKGNPHVFPGRGMTHIGAFSQYKADLDEKVAAAAKAAGQKIPEPWTIHDLRRTAKSLMARAGVRPDISERVLGHVIGGVEGIYDRHGYEAEKTDALKNLAGLIVLILNPPANNVVDIKSGQTK